MIFKYSHILRKAQNQLYIYLMVGQENVVPDFYY